jgi:hypothetical protein
VDRITRNEFRGKRFVREGDSYCCIKTLFGELKTWLAAPNRYGCGKGPWAVEKKKVEFGIGFVCN